MNDLIDALLLMRPYLEADARNPTWCEHDALHVCVETANIPEPTMVRLKELGFLPDSLGGLVSFRFGSC